MQGLTANPPQSSPERGAVVRMGAFHPFFNPSVQGVAQNRVPAVSEMHADLVGPAGAQAEPKQARSHPL